MQWRLSQPPIVAAQRALVFVGAFLSLVLTARFAPRAIAAYVLLVWVILLFFRVRQQEVFALWITYGFAYWALGEGQDEPVALLAVTSVAQVLAVLSHFALTETLRRNQWVMAGFGCLLVLPIMCNNPYYTPGFSLIRVALFIAVITFDPESTWVLQQYPLFCKREVLPFIVAIHVASHVYAPMRAPVASLLPVTQPAVQPPSPPEKQRPAIWDQLETAPARTAEKKD